MATKYYELKAPWSSIRLEGDEGHERISLWQDGGLSGTLVVDADKAPSAVLSFAGEIVGASQYTGSKKMQMVCIKMPRTKQVITDFGEVMEWGNLMDLMEKYR